MEGGNTSRNLLDMVNDLVESFRREEEITDYVKNLRLQLEETEEELAFKWRCLS